MRGIALLIMLASTLAQAAWDDYVETRELRLDAGGVSVLEIEAGAGSLTVTGDPNADEIIVDATITVSESDEDQAKSRIEKRLVLNLEQAGDTARLEGYFESGMFGWGETPSVALTVTLPQALGLSIDDGSGSMEVSALNGDVFIDDGSGSIRLSDSGGHVEIEDGSGGIEISGVAGDVRIDDGSGSVTVERVSGSVFVDDGSGSIRVFDVQQDFIVEADGSGGVDYDRVLGRIEIDE